MMQRHFARRLSCSPATLAYSTQAFGETSNLVQRSKLQRRRISFAASAASDSSSEARKARKRVSKDERRYLVESFVNKYRALNSGKFPTASEARKEVGGSYYTVRMMLQELQYRSQMPNINMEKESRIETEAKKKVEPSTNIEDVLSTQVATELDYIAYTPEIVKTPLQDRESTKGELEISDYLNINSDRSPSVSEEETSFSKTGTSSVRSDKPEALTEESDPHNEEPECDVTKFKADQLEQSREPEKLTRDLSLEQTDDADSPKKSFTWKSLKSLADGFLNMWRKL